MFILSNFLVAIAFVLDKVIWLWTWLIIIRALLSWVNPDPYNPIVQMLERLTEPVLVFFRKIVPPFKIGMDLSPLLAVIVLGASNIFIVQTLRDIATRIR